MNIKNGDTILDLYHIEGGPIKNGSTSIVWKALHKDWDTYLAIKQPKSDYLLTSDGREDFRRECNMWIKMGHHPHIVPCYYVREMDGELLVFSEWCDGGSLASYIVSGKLYDEIKKDSERSAVSVALQAMLGIRYAHKLGVVHKDIKPENIMLTSDGGVRITDFGSASAKVGYGTEKFLSPEQCKQLYTQKQSHKTTDDNCSECVKITTKTDIYSWAATVLLLHCGNWHEWEIGTDAGKYFEDIELSIEMRPQYKELLKQCLDEKPENRPEADEIVRNITTIYADILENDIALNYVDVEYAAETADSLNNMALSYLDIGEYESAETCWVNALKLQSAHPEATYNYNVYRWKNGKLSDLSLRKSIEVLPSSLIADYKREIERYTGCTKIIELTERVLYADGYCVGSIYFNKDGNSIMVSSRVYDSLKAWSLKTGELLFDKPFDDNISDEWLECVSSVKDMGIACEVFSDDSYGFCTSVYNISTGCRIATFPYALNDYIRCLSPDGNMFVIPFEHTLEIYPMPPQGVPKPMLCKFMSPNDVIRNKRAFYSLKADFERCLEHKDYKTAVKISKEIAEIPIYGCSSEYYDIKKALFPVCRRSNFKALLHEYYCFGISSARFSQDGRWFLAHRYDNHGVPDDDGVFVRDVSGVCADKYLYAPQDDDISRIIDFAYFDKNNMVVLECSEWWGENTVDVYMYNPENGEMTSTDSYNDRTQDSPKTIFPDELEDFCREHNYPVSCCDINADQTLMIAGNNNEFAVFVIDCDIECDEENPSALIHDIKSTCCEEVSNITVHENNTKNINSFIGFDDDNEFLIELAGDRAVKRLQALTNARLVNPLVSFQVNAKTAKEYLDGFSDQKNAPPHPDPAVEEMIAATDEEYDRMVNEVQRQAKYWMEKPDERALTLFVRSLSAKKEEPFRNVDVPERLSGFDKYNSFLLAPIYPVALHFNRLAWLRLANPDIKFTAQVNEAMNWRETHDDCEPHDDPEIQHILEVTDEEFDEMVRENARRSSYWNGEEKADFLTLFVRTVNAEEKQKSIVAAQNDHRFAGFWHISATELRRKNKLPQLIDKVQHMRNELLKNIVGQDHAVHAFCEGIFNSEVLKEADKNRSRPLAVFTFAGPPGVGKTYLAEQAAKCLGRPFKRFDMTEYAGHEAHWGLIGFESTWKNATSGQLTTFVHENPECVLLFDEIEKAHRDVIQIFYQMLDAGIVTDKFYSSKIVTEECTNDEKKRATVSFKDTIIILTTNAGRALYEGEYADNCAGVSTKMLLNELKTSGSFPAPIVSRIATGYPVLFNNLKPDDLVGIMVKEFSGIQELFEKQYGITLEADKETLLSLLYSEGGAVDARSLRARIGLFFKSELNKIFSSEVDKLSDMLRYRFCVNTEGLSDQISKIFRTNSTPEILLYSNKIFARNCIERLNGFVFHATQNADEAIKIAGEKEIALVIIDIAQRSYVDGSSDNERTMLVSMAASSFKDGKRLFSTLNERLPELPIYLLESTISLNEQLVNAFVRAGARGKLVEPRRDEYADFGRQLDEICTQLYMQGIAADIAAEQKQLYFETAPKIKGNEVVVDLRNFELRTTPNADDVKDLLSEAEKPTERFADVIGAESAKRELKFFVDFLKNPKKFASQGHRMPKGVLLYGKPGTGKTMLAKAMAGESDVTFIPAVASSFVKQYTGTGPAAVRELFQKARRYAPSIIFIDEVDTIAKQRTSSEFNRAEENTLNALLAEMDGFAVDAKRPVFVLAATNFGVEESSDGIGVLDEAFMRRFDRKIKIELPNTAERKQLLSVMISKLSNHNVSEDMLESIASRSVGTSPAILTNVIETAKRMAFDRQKPIDDAILDEAYEVTNYGNKKTVNADSVRRTACHECGHALISILGGNIPSYLTIEARGNHGGYMEFSEAEKTATSHSKDELIWRIRAALGGRAAEMVLYGADGVRTGASNDIYKATMLANAMITSYGMDEKLGLAYISAAAAETLPEVRARVNEILNEQLSLAIKLISENRDKFDRLYDELLLRNRLTSEEIEKLI